MDIVKMLIDEFKLKPFQVKNTIALLDEGNTIPFIARYRKEQTGEMEDVVLREFKTRLDYLNNLEDRKEEVIRLIDEQGKLSKKLKEKIVIAKTIQKVEDLYRPYRPKRRTRATIAKEKDLEPLAKIMLEQEIVGGNIEELAANYINEEKEVANTEEALAGAMDIVAEIVSDNAEIRENIRKVTFNRGEISTEGIDKEKDSVYKMYYSHIEKVKRIPNHRILAINRGEKDKYLRVKIIAPEEEMINTIISKVVTNEKAITTPYLKSSIEDSFKRLIFPSIEREVRTALTERAEEDAIKVFAGNLEPLLMQPPVKGKVVMGIDPGFRTGCKVAVVNEIGNLLDFTTVFPTEPQLKIAETKSKLKEFIMKYDIDIITIGNGTASRETEQVIAEMLQEIEEDVSYIIVNEAGASVYSASKVAQGEFPDMDVSIRGAVSIARRLQDPLAELVKIDPKHIGVGQYQHDLNQKKLAEALGGIVEDSVNRVGVDLNTASVSLLKYVSGISSSVAQNIVEYREKIGMFKNRKEILKVKRLGEKTFVQCAGFLRIPEGDYPLDNTGVHPESYEVAEKIMNINNYNNDNLKEMSKELNIGLPTLEDIIYELEKPGRDPREEMPKPILRKDILDMEDLKPNMILKGTVRNVVDFGAFVDVGVGQDGLVHISKLSDKFVKHPMEVVKVGDIVEVRVLEVDCSNGRISLSMKV